MFWSKNNLYAVININDLEKGEVIALASGKQVYIYITAPLQISTPASYLLLYSRQFLRQAWILRSMLTH